jgi:hypothetical protein
MASCSLVVVNALASRLRRALPRMGALSGDFSEESNNANSCCLFMANDSCWGLTFTTCMYEIATRFPSNHEIEGLTRTTRLLHATEQQRAIKKENLDFHLEIIVYSVPIARTTMLRKRSTGMMIRQYGTVSGKKNLPDIDGTVK